MRDFSAATIRALARKGITIYGITCVPDHTSSMPFANAIDCWKINDNGCGRIWTYAQVKEAAK